MYQDASSPDQRAGPGCSEVLAAWAQRARHEFKRERDGDGFVVDGKFGELPWRLEWGPPQRDYIQGEELRLRMELGVPPDLQMLVVSNVADGGAREAGLRAVHRKQRRRAMDTATPEEMRWLVMFPKIALQRLEDAALRTSPASRGLPNEASGVARGPARRTRSSAPPAACSAAGAAVRADDAARRVYLRLAAEQRRRDRRRGGARAVRDRGDEALRVGRARGDEPVTWRADRVDRAGRRSTPPAPGPRRTCSRARRRAAAQARVLAELHLGDRVAVHFVRAVGEAQRARAGVEAGEREVARRRRRRRAPASPSRSPGRPCSAPPP